MKILFLSNRDLASNVALNILLPIVSKNNEVHLWLSAKVGKTNVLPKQLASLKFFEQDLFNRLLAPLLQSSNSVGTYKPFQEFSVYISSEIREVNQINSPQVLDDLKQLSPDLIVSIRYGTILKEAAINIPTKGVINLHSGILPKYKGVMATFWALKNNESHIGTTLHTIDDGSIDSGNIISISKTPVNRNKSYLWHVLELYRQGAIDVLEAIEVIGAGKRPISQPQDESHSYFTFPSAQECTEFEESGLKMVDERAYLDFIQDYYF